MFISGGKIHKKTENLMCEQEPAIRSGEAQRTRETYRQCVKQETETGRQTATAAYPPALIW